MVKGRACSFKSTLSPQLFLAFLVFEIVFFHIFVHAVVTFFCLMNDGVFLRQAVTDQIIQYGFIRYTTTATFNSNRIMQNTGGFFQSRLMLLYDYFEISEKWHQVTDDQWSNINVKIDIGFITKRSETLCGILLISDHVQQTDDGQQKRLGHGKGILEFHGISPLLNGY